MQIVLPLLAALVYAVSAALYLGVVLGERRAWSRPALITLGVGLAVHLAALGGWAWGDGVASLATIQRGLSLVAWVVAGGFVVAHAAYKLRSLGSFVLPLVVLLQALSVIAEPGFEVDRELQGPLLVVHIISALIGSGLFFLAALAAVAYLLQERALKRKRFGGIFERLPSVDVLDRLSYRLIAIGFPIYTGAIGLGSLWAWEHEGGATLELQYLFAVVSWLIYAALLQSRVTTGWRGRRAATLTLAGLVGTAAVLSTYALRAWGVGLG